MTGYIPSTELLALDQPSVEANAPDNIGLG